MARIKTSGIEV
jgi:hypothetical protein